MNTQLRRDKEKASRKKRKQIQIFEYFFKRMTNTSSFFAIVFLLHDGYYARYLHNWDLRLAQNLQNMNMLASALTRQSWKAVKFSYDTRRQDIFTTKSTPATIESKAAG